MVVMFGEGGKGEGRVDGSEVGRMERGWEGEIVKEEIATESYYAKPHCVITQLLTSCNNDVILFLILPHFSHISVFLYLLPSASSHKTSQAQGPSPIFSATGHTFRRIVVDQTTGQDNVTYVVMFIN